MKRNFLLGALIIAGCGRHAADPQAGAANPAKAQASAVNAVAPAVESSGHSIVDSAGATVGFVAGTLDGKSLKLDINLYRLPRGRASSPAGVLLSAMRFPTSRNGRAEPSTMSVESARPR